MTLAVVVLLMGVSLLGGCSSEQRGAVAPSDAQASSATSSSDAVKRITAEGYPLDRSLKGMVGFPDTDTILLVENSVLGSPQRWSQSAHGYDKGPRWIVTPVAGTAAVVYRGQVGVDSPVTFVIAGGRVGNDGLVADRSLAPQFEDFATYPRILIGGKAISSTDLGPYIDPYFIYGVDGQGVATSLVDSAGGPPPPFTLDDLEASLRGK